MLLEPGNCTRAGGCQHARPGDLLLSRCTLHRLRCGRKEGDFSPKSEWLLPALSLADGVCPHHPSPPLGSCYLLSSPAKAAGKPLWKYPGSITPVSQKPFRPRHHRCHAAFQTEKGAALLGGMQLKACKSPRQGPLTPWTSQPCSSPPPAPEALCWGPCQGGALRCRGSWCFSRLGEGLSPAPPGHSSCDTQAAAAPVRRGGSSRSDVHCSPGRVRCERGSTSSVALLRHDPLQQLGNSGHLLWGCGNGPEHGPALSLWGVPARPVGQGAVAEVSPGHVCPLSHHRSLWRRDKVVWQWGGCWALTPSPARDPAQPEEPPPRCTSFLSLEGFQSCGLPEGFGVSLERAPRVDPPPGAAVWQGRCCSCSSAGVSTGVGGKLGQRFCDQGHGEEPHALPLAPGPSLVLGAAGTRTSALSTSGSCYLLPLSSGQSRNPSHWALSPAHCGSLSRDVLLRLCR